MNDVENHTMCSAACSVQRHAYLVATEIQHRSVITYLNETANPIESNSASVSAALNILVMVLGVSFVNRVCPWHRFGFFAWDEILGRVLKVKGMGAIKVQGSRYIIASRRVREVTQAKSDILTFPFPGFVSRVEFIWISCWTWRCISKPWVMP